MRVTVHYQDLISPHYFEREPGFPFWTMSITIAGRTPVFQGSRSVVFEPGILSLIRPGTPYRLHATQSARHAEYYALLAMPSHWKSPTGWPEPLPGWLALKIQGTSAWKPIVAAFKIACSHSASGEPGEELALNALERVLLLAAPLSPSSQRALIDERIEAALAFARARLDTKLDVVALARAAHLSPSRLAHLFAAQMGESPMRHIEGLRIRRAQELLLSTRMRVREIAQAVGYENPYHFSDRFRSRTGRSPRAFRRKPI